ncbi:MAG TPA: AarF/UbiB family protein, partial [Oscillatoriaceae cyanobacterium]
VLAQERIYGYRFDDEHAIRAAGIDYIEIAEVVIRAFTKQVFEDCFFHADSHPGNLFVTPEGNVVYLDFGMVEEIDPAFQAQLVEMFIHVIQQDWPAFLEDMVNAGIVPAETPREALLPIFTDVWAAQLGFTDKRYTLQEVSDRFYAIVRQYPFRLPERFLFLTRTSASLEGVVYRADPSFKFLPIALPFFAKLVLSRIDVENPWIIQDMLRAAKDGVMLDRLSGLLRMAMADEPEAMGAVADKLVEVALHPKAGPLREELKNRLLGGDLALMETLLPSFRLSAKALSMIEAFLVSPTGRTWIVGLLEDPRFPAFAGPFLKGRRVTAELPLDLIALFLHWFPAGAERQRAYAIIQRLLASPEFPWSTMVDPRHQLQQLQNLQLSGTVPRAEHLPLLLEFLGQRGTLPLLAKGVIKGWSDRFRERVTKPLLGGPELA